MRDLGTPYWTPRGDPSVVLGRGAGSRQVGRGERRGRGSGREWVPEPLVQVDETLEEVGVWSESVSWTVDVGVSPFSGSPLP